MSKNLKVLSLSLAFYGLFSAQAFAQCSGNTSLSDCFAFGQKCQWNATATCEIFDQSKCELTTCSGNGCQLIVDTTSGTCVNPSLSETKRREVK